MPPRGSHGPGLNSKTVKATLAQFVDGGGASGTFTCPIQIPAGALAERLAVRVNKPFIGDTSAVITIGDGSDVDRYNTGAPSVFTTGHKEAGAPSGTVSHTAAVTPVFTITSGSDFTAVTGGEVEVTFFWKEPF